eukprot:TRINITY_DN13887_c0_g1_i3.p1 TRINITY_DN13887_c0_g1~~TRINITY_DN13887_c0_g1_i3.p1  ORF type:complete len:482 (-),score=159.18 TRINITY_DN13887_c0_g1_i3:73-1518(-)
MSSWSGEPVKVQSVVRAALAARPQLRVTSHDVSEQAHAAAVQAERRRLAPEFEDLYRQRAAFIEEQAQEARLKTAPQTVSAVDRRQQLALEGQLIQETVLADELQAARAKQETQIEKLEAALAAEVDASEEVAQADARRTEHSRLEEEVLAVRDRSEALELRMANLEVEAQQAALEKEAVPPAVLGSLATAEAEEQELAERVTRECHEEASARKEAAHLKEQILDLSGDFGVALMDAKPSDELKGAEEVVYQQLRQKLKDHDLQDPTLGSLLERLEKERDAVVAEIHSDADHQLKAARQDTNELVRQLSALEGETLQTTRRLAEVKGEILITGESMSDIESRLSEAAALRKESQLLSQQKAEWQRSEQRMLKLAEDLRSALPQAHRGGHVRGSGEPEMQQPGAKAVVPENRATRAELAQVTQANQELKQRVRRLEEEKAHLVHSQRGLESFVRAKMPDIEAKLQIGGIADTEARPHARCKM